MAGSKSLNVYLAGFATILIAPMLLLSMYATYHFAMAERARLEALADNANQDLVLLIDHEITTREAMLRTLSTAQSLRTGDLERFEQQVRELAQVENMQFIMTDLTGQQMINTKAPAGSKLPRTGNPDLYQHPKVISDIFVSNLFTGSLTGQLLVQVSIPLRRDGEVFAILSATLLPERLFEIVREGVPKGPFYATILDRTGTIVARSVDPARFIGKPLPALADGAQGDKGSLSMINAQGIPIFAYWRRPAVSGWVVAAAVEHAALTAPLTQSLWLLALVILVVTFLVVLGAYWIGRRLTRAHGSLIVAAEAIGRGQRVDPFTTPLREANRVGEVLVTASRLLREHDDALRRTNQDLEQRVSQRTQELKEKAALLETTIDTMRQGLIVVGPDGRVPICSTRARALLDLPDALMDGAPSFDRILAYQDDRREYAKLAAPVRQRLHALEAGGIGEFEYERPDGTILQVQTAAVLVGGGVVRTITDITEQARHAHELELARDAAEQANRAKDEFLANISHEMRTPLNAVIGYSELLLKDMRAGSGLVRHAERINRAGAALLTLVDDVLDFERVGSGYFEVRTERFATSTLVENAVSIVRPDTKATTPILTYEIAADADRHFLADRERISQILVNLLSNAIKFTPDGWIALSIASLTDAAGSSKLRLTVTDTGIGIEEADQTLIFDRFCRVDGSNQRRFNGVGLGLTISKQIVERLGGQIGVHSRIGMGSTFWFEVPVEPAETAAPTRTAARASRARAARILVAEDVMLNQELAREILEMAGYVVDVVGNGSEAVAAARSGIYDLILMDLSMPEMDGLTATRLIRQHEHDPQRVPIVACTANVLPAHKRAFVAAGVDAYLCKPLRQIELYSILDNFLSHADASANDDQGPGLAPDPERDIIALLGPTCVLKGLESLKVELDVLDAARPKNLIECKDVARQAHALISTACMLEMDELSDLCRDIENSCDNLASTNRALDQLKARKDFFLVRARAMIESIRQSAA